MPTHNPVNLAKQLATVDVFSNGRLTVGVGTGGREEDYAAAGTDLSQKRIAVMEAHVATMRRVWAGENVVPGALRPVEPFPIQLPGPSVIAGVMGPKGLASAAKWSDGIAGMSISAQAKEAAQAFDQAREAWREAGRSEAPVLNTAFWFALGDDPNGQIETHLTRYFNWIDPAAREYMVKQGGFRGSGADLKDRLKAFAGHRCR